MSLRDKSVEAILGWWAQELGVNAPELMVPVNGVTLSANSSLPGIFVFRRGNDLRIAALLQILRPIHDAIMDQTFDSILDAEFWKQHPALAGKVIGPANLYYLDAVPEQWSSLAPRGTLVRGLSAMDAKAFGEFFETLSPEEREHSALEFGHRPLWGVFKSRDLVAVSGYDSWPGQIAHIGVGVNPSHRGGGMGQLAVQAAARAAFARRRVVQYRALADDRAAVGLAEALHFEPFAQTLFIRPPAAA